METGKKSIKQCLRRHLTLILNARNRNGRAKPLGKLFLRETMLSAQTTNGLSK